MIHAGCAVHWPAFPVRGNGYPLQIGPPYMGMSRVSEPTVLPEIAVPKMIMREMPLEDTNRAFGYMHGAVRALSTYRTISSEDGPILHA